MEPALQDMLQEVANRRGTARAISIAAPRGDSQGNGHAEKAVRGVEEYGRVRCVLSGAVLQGARRLCIRSLWFKLLYAFAQ